MSALTSPKDWLILQCHACGSPMKVRAQAAAGARVSCPVCRSPVAVERGADMRSPEFRADLPQNRDRQPNESPHRKPAEEQDEEFIPGFAKQAARNPMAEFSGVLPEHDDSFLQNLKRTEEHHSGKHVKVKSFW